MKRSTFDTRPTSFPRRNDALAVARRGRLVRRMTVVGMAAFVAVGLFGGLGIRQATQTTTGDGLRFEISYPAVTRGGLPARWILEIRTDEATSLPDEIEVGTTAGYFELFDHNGLTPEPDEVWQDDAVSWTFRPNPDDNRLRVELDVRTQPNTRWRYAATTDIVIDGVTTASFEYSTFVVP